MTSNISYYNILPFKLHAHNNVKLKPRKMLELSFLYTDVHVDYKSLQC